MKRIYWALIAGVLSGCSPKEPDTLNLSYEVVEDGGAVKLSWNEIEGADYYRVDVDGDSVAGVTGTTYTVRTPGKTLTVTAIGVDSSESVSFEVVLSRGVKVWTVNDPNIAHPSWVIFDTLGNARAASYAEKDSAAWFMNDDAADTAWLNTNWAGEGGWNRNLSVWFAVESGNIDDIKLAPGLGDYYYRFPPDYGLGDNQVGAFWYDGGADGSLGHEDHFGKFIITDYTPADPTYPSVTMDIYWQSEPGLRWLVR
jgi:hypothetical protein